MGCFMSRSWDCGKSIVLVPNLRLVSPLSSISSRNFGLPIADHPLYGQRKTSQGQMSPLMDSGGLSSKTDKPLSAGLPPNSSSSAFIPILPDSEVSSAFGLKSFSSLGSKSDPVLQIQYPMPWRILAERKSFYENVGISENLVNWRRGRDLNPRRYNLIRLAGVRLKPYSATSPQ